MEQLKGDPDSSDGNGRVSQVECRPVVATQVKIEEIGDRSQADPVNKVPHGSSQNQAEPEKDFSPFLALTAGPVDQ